MQEYNRCHGCMEEKTKDTTCPHCGWAEGSLPESTLNLPLGTVLQVKYLIGKALGQGGFGITYLAWDMNLNLKLAIKEYLPQELAYRTGGQSEISIYKKSLSDNFNYGLEKFLEEARTLARFNEHPNIISVRDFFKANGTAYLVMNHIEGVTLKEYLAGRDKPLTFEQALDIFMPVLDALKEVHTVGILHRDISPDNLLLDAKGRVVLIDFGAARQAMGDKSRSMSVIMKAGYSPEEQYRSRGEQGPWTDIYAVAATMYHAITGVMPPESLDRMAEDTLNPPSQLGVKIRPHLEQALLKAMALRSKDRYQAVEVFQGDLLGKEPIVDKESPKAVKAETDKPSKPQNEYKDTKNCPYCGEEVLAGAIKCKHCRSVLELQKFKQGRPLKDSAWVISEDALVQPTDSKFSTEKGVSSSHLNPVHEPGTEDYSQVVGVKHQYPRAVLGRRFLAFIIDYLITGLPIAAAILMVELYNGFTPVNYTPWFLIAFLPIGLWSIIYPLVRDGFAKGQSLGKKMCGLMVIDVKANQPCTKKKSVLRNLFWLVIPYFIFVEIILVFYNEKGLRLGDMAAKTQTIDVDKFFMPKA